MVGFSQSKFYDFELTRLLGSAPFGGCDVAEFIEAIGKIKKHDPESWYRAWHEQGERVSALAREAVTQGHFFSARRAYLRSSNYFRACSYLLPSSDTRVLESAGRSIELFREAITYMDEKVIVLQIPLEAGTLLPGYLYLPTPDKRLKGAGAKTPVLINCGGADATQEELYYLYVVNGVELGYAVLTFEGPGQGMVLRKDRIPMRPDYEIVTEKVLDHVVDIAMTYPELGLDLDRIAVAGASMGAYYSLRASIDPRVKACVAVDPFHSLWTLALTRMPKFYAHLWQTGWIPESVFNLSVRVQLAMDFPSRWEFGLGSWMMGTSTPGETLRRFQEFSLDIAKGGKILDNVRCPVFLTGAGQTIYAAADMSTIYIYDALKKVPEDQKEVWIPDKVGDGGLTAKVGAWGLLAQKSYEFLDKHLDLEKRRRP
ncbi:hypothetical protein UA08_04447 [Talaromyces atroroseus]|uniref:AB hydrolase-1 domain-containing protein n=1 Tax=Talaromyces atroroseus TaxID=1441469 RepID=A0A1Q5Q9G4_TALAT|nr:hypothetical protein UA08_04447 [Talaromyces atroroseus]OKL60773.1 hypothetical protein UA08_04447 [Talaromyces atroroseus]